ncbi:FAD-dependent oxidoreductase [Haloferax mediterranei ATCC 33500]|uniref:Oxidoreductase n=1 Tax=Haloferax mediterranei (strain ATCC 33500 / DSM 1411 / JCM 8866 / NBRC 14739 / NCIMB 2177 / R-4) TaxID=523841 RepID=I3R2X4_HALMT|nr:FAD-dependent oxidoreductase [Haloferax mediterranei]AFK18584.1 flavodoxin reductase family protein / cytochrome-b5 reductase [Haloferax mediterranei ATCC 33500]AHZ22042.1 oxidoreductase [Haloferax mediterranei ATCC 33500]EMA02141.1 flavodoxin reductase family protein / cytochrome-b5 reductase [Haloferax mediterranei ATCC 33500]MDX5988672.1 FAD-dependent oxidoreductase [Haloferax mediterranei ATCC 33500]QCQ75084.1 FAD-dependent oxidoreductase [Haloferax mediterranei ATCC 33500]
MDATVTVSAARNVGPGTVAIEFETPDGFEAEPGQFVKLTAEVDGESYARFYTLSSPGVGDTFEVTVGIDPEEAGPFSQHLESLAEGDTIDLSGPFGDSYYDGEARVVVLAGGPGIGPAVGIAEAAVADDNEAAVVYLDDAPAHEDRLDALRDGGASVVVTDDEDALAGAVSDALVNGDDEQVFVYGFAGFVDAAVDAIENAGGDVDAAKIENFG